MYSKFMEHFSLFCPQDVASDRLKLPKRQNINEETILCVPSTLRLL